MRYPFLAVLILAVGAAAAAAQSPAPSPAEPPRILPAEVKALAEKGKVLIVDVRDKGSYDFEHAEGAISIPLGELEARMKELPKNKQIAAYCT
jgi:rhodanese-related sulfurtransferase